jgi:hypothetical protein
VASDGMIDSAVDGAILKRRVLRITTIRQIDVVVGLNIGGFFENER